MVFLVTKPGIAMVSTLKVCIERCRLFRVEGTAADVEGFEVGERWYFFRCDGVK